MQPQKMDLPILIVSIVILSFSSAHENDICTFNRLCTCRKSHHEVICRGVPFLEFPSSIPEYVYQVTIIRSGLEYLDNHIFQGSSVASLHLMQNNIIHISPKTFNGLENILTTLDLSNNRITEFPFSALHNLNNLQWLNLYGNKIDSFHSFKLSHLNSKSVLHSVFLGSNYLRSVPEGAFVKLSNLNLLDLDGNLIHDVGIHPFPISLTSLSLSNNILKKVPLHAIYYLKNVRSLYFSGNLIEKLPCPFYLHVRRLDKLEISNNLLVELPECVFNSSLVIKELHLEFNFLRYLSARSFKNTRLERLVVANNRLTGTHSDAFEGVEKSLVTLDLSYNLIDLFPPAVNNLKSLVFLSLKSNLLKFMEKSDLHGCRGSLEVLDLSGNAFSSVPKPTLKSLSKLMRLSLQDNQIHKIYRDDFLGWGKSLITLSLANNKMTYLSVDSFIYLTKLKELKLSFNNLMHLNQNTFLPLKNSLEFVDLSSAFTTFNHPVDSFVKDLEKLEWCQMDHNNISKLSISNTKTLPKLRHLDISNNHLRRLPRDIFSSVNHKYLTTAHIISNDLKTIEADAFSDLAHLSSAVLFGNKISTIESYAFQNCPFLHTVVLANNNVSVISESAFYNLSRLTNLYLQDNQIEVFTLDSLEGDTAQLYINVSNNALHQLEVSNRSANNTIKIRTLDLTNNKLSVINDMFFAPMSDYLIRLFLSKNQIPEVVLPHLPALQVLEVSHNALTGLEDDSFACCPSVQILKLDHNFIHNISDNALRNTFNLRILDLSHNKLNHLSQTAFSETKLERLNISGNNFTAVPSPALLPVRETIRHLDLSFNSIGNLSGNAFSGFSKLRALNLSSNQISFLHDTSFTDLSNLMELDVSHNPLRYVGEENAFSYLVNLRSLFMRNTSLMSVNNLPMPHLNVLVLRDNFLFNVSEMVFKESQHVRCLDLSGNLLQDVPHHLWRNMKFLVDLDLSRNPIDVLGINSFSGLDNLQRLDISGLLLKRLDPRALHGLRYLTTIKTDSYASVRSFRLQDLLFQSPAIRKVTINVEESTLSHQVQRAFGTKLRELIITGLNLQRILPDAFAGLSTHELTLRISGTTVSKFPDGLLKYLPDIRYLTLDLRDNHLTSMSPGVLAAVTRDGTDIHQTQHIAGGVLIEENPWNCNCDLLWLGQWLRRWLRETFHVHMLSIDAALYVNTVSRNAKCYKAGTNVSVSIIDLRRSDLRCESTVSAAASIVPKYWKLLIMGVCLVSKLFYSAQSL